MRWCLRISVVTIRSADTLHQHSPRGRPTPMSDPSSKGNTITAPGQSTTDPAFEAAVWRKVTFRLLPFLFVLYLLNILDRVNVGFGKLTMLDDLGLDARHYGFFAGLFYISYILFEVPSNLILNRT